MGIERYKVDSGVSYFRVDEWLTRPDGPPVRFRKKKIPTREQAIALVAKKKTEAFEGRFFDVLKTPTLAVADVWAVYKPITERDNDTASTDAGRAAHLIRHLGKRRATSLTQADVDEYRRLRLGEVTKRKAPPKPATLDREVELLKRMLNYAVTCKRLVTNPVERVSLLRRPNVRKRMITEEQFRALDAALVVAPKDTAYASAVKRVFRAIVMTAFDTGERKMEILSLKRSQLHEAAGYIELTADDTKTEEARRVYLTRRALAAIATLPKNDDSEYVFLNPETGKPYQDIRKLWAKYRAKAGIADDTWFHDHRRSYITNARRRGIDERTIMRQSGHKTRAAFDRYNIVDDSDQREAVKKYEAGLLGHVLDTGTNDGPKNAETPSDFDGVSGVSE